jgi:hypothetical protein
MEGIEVDKDLTEEVKDEVVEETKKMKNGTLLEAAFVDSAYSWPPADGEGKNAVELQVVDDDSYMSGPSEKGVEFQSVTTTTTTSRGWFNFKCCRSDKDVITTEQGKKLVPNKKKKLRRKKKKEASYKSVPEGILIYKLDTADRSIKLVSEPSSNTDVNTLLTSMVVADAKPGADKSRRAIDLVGVDGTKATLVACEQRSAIAWLEAMDMMLGNTGRGDKVGVSLRWYSC